MLSFWDLVTCSGLALVTSCFSSKVKEISAYFLKIIVCFEEMVIYDMNLYYSLLLETLTFSVRVEMGTSLMVSVTCKVNTVNV